MSSAAFPTDADDNRNYSWVPETAIEVLHAGLDHLANRGSPRYKVVNGSHVQKEIVLLTRYTYKAELEIESEKECTVQIETTPWIILNIDKRCNNDSVDIR
ncbi:cystatin-like protein [Drosophila guanche]|uniref:Blast:Cystatin-like protein n=1 Tax=Drosophila guanche TaxID=7266 RepID=A0A3B0K9P0_DROGU|nr:cystatin-like protein [Drosophila guanche]SPP82789.1 blast:Cystatin-like protein [Drosophila guanche]